MANQPRSMGTTGLGIGAGLRRHAERLLDQQMWCLGRDIRHPDGNALLRYGFEVWRPPTNVIGGNAYTWSPPGGGLLTVWAFGLCFAGAPADGLLYLGRFQFKPTWRAASELPVPPWDTTRLPRFETPRNEVDWARVRRLTAGALDAIALYEEWADTVLGRDHRRATVESWFKPRFAPARIAPSWRSLARRVGRQVA